MKTSSKAKNAKKSTGTVLLELLEARLDCVIYRLGFASTIPAARQIVNHGHILINGKLVDVPSFICKEGDSISIRNRDQSKSLIKTNFETQEQKRKLIQRRMKRVNLTKSRFQSLLPSHLEINPDQLIGKFLSPVKRKDVLLRINELKLKSLIVKKILIGTNRALAQNLTSKIWRCLLMTRQLEITIYFKRKNQVL